MKKLGAPPKQLTPGRPKTALGASNVSEAMPKIGELPKKIIGSHMGSVGALDKEPLTEKPSETPAMPKAGPALPKPPKMPKAIRKAPPTLAY